MPKFRFAVRSPEGKLRSGTVTETSQEAARQRLKAAGYTVVSLQEESELVIHESKAPTGVARPKLERAAIIEFETTFSERLGQLLQNYLLRKEFAVVLFAAGAGLGGYLYMSRPKPAAVAEAKYELLNVEVKVDQGLVPGKGTLYKAMLPDIPWQFTQPVADGPVLKTSFESLKRPGRVQVSLEDDSGTVLGSGDALLSTKAGGTLVAEVPLSPLKKSP